MSRPPKKPLPPAARLNFLLGASDKDLSSFELARLAEVANLRSDLHAILDKLIDEMAQAAVAGWFRQTTREKLKQALESLENPERRINEVVSWAKKKIRDGQRSEEELVPRASLPPGKAHLAAALRYQERNIAKGLCAVCPEKLDRNSVRYCPKHLLAMRLRKKPKGAKGGPPGSREWLYSGIFESAHNKALSQIAALEKANEERRGCAVKQHRSTPAEEALYGYVAKLLGMSPAHVRAVALGQRRSKRVSTALNEAMAGALKEANEKRKRGKS